MSEQPERVPEVKPTEQIAPESPAPEPDDSQNAVLASEAPPPEAPPAEIAPIEKKSKPAKKAPPKKGDNYTLVAVVSALRSLILTFAAAVIVSTIFMWFTTPDFLSAQTRQGLAVAQATAISSTTIPPTALPPVQFRTKRIGVLAGHNGIATEGRTRGNVDPGAVCPDGFTEASVTLNVAKQVVKSLQGRNYTVDMLDEYDQRLYAYNADVFISLHADSCEDFQDGFDHSGFKNIYPVSRFTIRNEDIRLNDCLQQSYGAATQIPFTPSVITLPMKYYHVWEVLGQTTPATILELGNLHDDRNLLEHQSDKVAAGIVNGLLCYLQPPVKPTDVPNTPIASPVNVAVSTATAPPQ